MPSTSCKQLHLPLLNGTTLPGLPCDLKQGTQVKCLAGNCTQGLLNTRCGPGPSGPPERGTGNLGFPCHCPWGDPMSARPRAGFCRGGPGHRQSVCPGAQRAGLSARTSPLGPCFPFDGTSHPLPLCCSGLKYGYQWPPPHTVLSPTLVCTPGHLPASSSCGTCSAHPLKSQGKANRPKTPQEPGFHFLYSQDSSSSQ